MWLEINESDPLTLDLLAEANSRWMGGKTPWLPSTEVGADGKEIRWSSEREGREAQS